MKSIYILSTALLIGLSSCDPLDVDPTTSVFEEQFWTNPQLSRAFVNQFYLWMPATVNNAHQAEQWSDNAIGNNDRDQNTFRQTTFTHREYDELNGSVFGAPWGDVYKNIRATNLAIERIPNVPNIAETEINQLLAETYLFRAMFYMELERYWGGVPYIDKVMNIFDDTMLPRCTREELFDRILADIDKSIDYFKKGNGSSTVGYASENAAQGIKSRAALYAACAAAAAKTGTYENLKASDAEKAIFRFEKDPSYYYQIAYDASKTILGKYELESEYSNLFNSATGHMSKECIWPIMFNFENRSAFNPAQYSGPKGRYYGCTTDFDKSYDMNGGAFPTQDLVDCYYQKDAADGKWKQWWKTEQSTQLMGGTMNDDGTYKAVTEDYSAMYQDRDKRFYATILYDGAYYAGVEKPMYLIGTWIDNSKPRFSEKFSALHTGFRSTEIMTLPSGGSSMNSITGYYVAKYVPGKFNIDGTVNKSQTPISIFMLRYAEILLNYAEAAYKLGKSDEALLQINAIRNRAGLSDFNASDVGHDLWEEYKLQRRIEFAFEQPSHRYFDLLRWGESEGKSTIEELNRLPRGMYIFRKGIESTKIEDNGYPAPKTDPEYFTPIVEVKPLDYSHFEKKFDEAVYYKIPFSRTTLQSNKSMVQNPGWSDRSYQ